MASSDSIQLALATVQTLNGLNKQLRGIAKEGLKTLSKVDSLIENPDKLTILQDGLTGIGVTSTALKDEKNSYETVCLGDIGKYS